MELEPELSELLTIQSNGDKQTEQFFASGCVAPSSALQSSSLSTISLGNPLTVQDSVDKYREIEKTIIKIPQFAREGEFLEFLAQSLKEASWKDSLSDKAARYEIIVENQRGSTLFGVPMYSKQSMFYGADPPTFQALNGCGLGNMGIYPLPGRDWRWSWDSWHVMMISDVDEDGWVYSNIRFGSKYWKGTRGFGRMVRRRVWVRMAERVTVEHDNDSDSELASTLIVNGGAETSRDVSSPKDLPERSSNLPLVKLSVPVALPDPELELKSFCKSLSKEVLDRLKSQRILEFFLNADTSLLAYLTNDFDKKHPAKHIGTSSYLRIITNSTWIDRLIMSLRFHESRTIFLRRLSALIDDPPLQISPEKRTLLEQICKDGYICIGM
ncbi:hypothetical protein FOA43_000083 [Brettanomyces nanus]|uniref:Peroxin/Ferlin domain-containing protein n=1 Tax=Eeniella nana TaxID=13502 RepID=A0A875RVC2_EENNA|nr:uncharacterized protein FOA43_000083 [Brettanomyces nanus]QPG72781.1 hypothetical protein FOA43_000083 [Brettanomyces nanus]